MLEAISKIPLALSEQRIYSGNIQPATPSRVFMRLLLVEPTGYG